MQLMLNVCNKFAEEFDMRFNGSKSVAMRAGNRYNENCSDVKRGQSFETEAEAEAKNNYEKSTK